MADITECPPDWLKERAIGSTIVEVLPAKAKSLMECGWPAPGHVKSGNVIFFVCPVPQKDSGVLTVIE